MKKLLFPLTMLFTSLAVSSAFQLPDADQLLPTRLRITVLNELGNIEEGATVKLFMNGEDFEQGVNVVQDSLLTDKKGRVTFKGLAPRIYFVLVEKEDKNNFTGGNQTAKLEEGKINKVNIVIE